LHLRICTPPPPRENRTVPKKNINFKLTTAGTESQKQQQKIYVADDWAAVEMSIFYYLYGNIKLNFLRIF
jgi:hypothetical protein